MHSSSCKWVEVKSQEEEESISPTCQVLCSNSLISHIQWPDIGIKIKMVIRSKKCTFLAGRLEGVISIESKICSARRASAAPGQSSLKNSEWKTKKKDAQTFEKEQNIPTACLQKDHALRSQLRTPISRHKLRKNASHRRNQPHLFRLNTQVGNRLLTATLEWIIFF